MTQILAVLLGLVFAGTALAQDPVYTAEVRVKSQGTADTQNGMARALIQVLERVSGDPNVKMRPYLGRELKNARALAKSHDFVQKEGLNAAGVPSFGTNLIVQFHPDRVRALVNRIGLQYWPEPRKKPLAWLVIDDGQHGPRLVGIEQGAAARPLLEKGLMRGIQIVLPKGNVAERALAGAIIRKDLRAISVASAAYAGDTQLVGYVKRNGDAWTGQWTFIERGQVMKDWETEDKDPFAVLAEGGNGAAESLIRRYAIAGRAPTPPPLTPEELAALEAEKAAAALGASGDDPALAGSSSVTTVSVIRESFGGISSSADYGALMGKLNQIPGVKHVTTVRTTPGGVEVDITYQGDPGALKAAIAMQGLNSGGSKVIQQSTPPPAPAAEPTKPAATPEPAKPEPAKSEPPPKPNGANG